MFAGMQDTKFAHGSQADAGDAGAASMKLAVNGQPLQSSAATLLALLAHLGYSAQRVATAVNGEFVPERLRAERLLTDGDKIEIVAPRQGG